jgi:hypothetical protein
MGNRLIRRDRKDVAEKNVRALFERRQQLARAKWKGDRERFELEKPVFWGWRRRFVLSESAATRQDAPILANLLQVLQKEEDSRRRDFKYWDWRARRWGQWNHTPRRLSVLSFARLPLELKPYFEGCFGSKHGHEYHVRFPWMFETRVSKLYLTHCFLPNMEREREESFMNAKIEQGQLYGAYQKIKSRKARWKGYVPVLPKDKLMAVRHREEIAEALEIHAVGQLQAERGKEVIQNAKT